MTAVTVAVSPARLAEPVQVVLRFTTDSTIVDTNYIQLSMPGYTSGSTTNSDDGNNVFDQTVIKKSPSALWDAYWYQGTVANSFSDSYFKFYPATGVVISPGTYSITVDKTIRVKKNCATKPAEVHVLTDETLGTFSVPASDSTSIAGGCYFTDTRLDVVEPLDRRWLELSVTFKPAMNILAGEAVFFNLAGFTNSNFTGLDKAGLTASTCVGKGGCNDDTVTLLDDTSLAYLSTTLFKVHWLEDAPLATSKHLAGYVNSTLVLKVESGQQLTAGTLYTVTLDRENKIGTLCSLPGNYEKIRISTNATLGTVAPIRVIHTDPVGRGCVDYGHCSGHGTCDYCEEKCDCVKEYGGTGAIVDADISPSCNQLVCPAGHAWGTLPTVTNNGHGLMECSNAGTCDRSKGECSCFDGFRGLACERKECPVFNSVICAGHGTCLSMHQLSMKTDALPLSDPTNVTVTSDRTWPIYGGSRSGLNDGITSGNITWDERTLHRCHCDSSWPVGLGAGERQQSEWFGPACQFKRCPSGDDPLTKSSVGGNSNAFNESTCEGVVAEGGKGIGKKGNICHVDCSNRGLCDHTLGTCECFKGFWGVACDKIKEIDIGDAV
jgi:hypothetical protein